MVERLKNKRGFTIIEVMVVIALIGILAAVLVPQFGGVKDRARDAGVLTNAKMVEAYVASVIDTYNDASNLESAIKTQFGDGALKNPYSGEETADATINVTTSSSADYSGGATGSGADADDDAGIVYVVIDEDDLTTYINGFDSKGNEIEASKRKISR